MPSLEEFVDTVEHSGLIEEAVWRRWYAQNAAAFTTGEGMAQALIDKGLITDWQSGMLREGRWRGFFLGKYKILGQLGAGSMGAVYLAEHTLMRHRVAIKVMAQRLQKSQRHLERFQREAQATASVNHPRIVRAFDVEIAGNTPYLVMEYVEGDDLQKIVQEEGVLPVSEAAEIIRQSAEGLEAAHKAGLVHRDIKPSNILLDKQGQVHILDLGLARVEADEEASMTLMHNSKALGTVDYLAPEQARDSHAVDARADIYSLGCTLYFLLAGTPVYNEGSIAQRILAHQSQPVPDVRKTRPEVPDNLIRILEKMLAKERAGRFASAGDVAAALEAFLAGRSIGEFLATGEEAELMRLDIEEAAEPLPSKSLVARAVAAAVAEPALANAPATEVAAVAAPAADSTSAIPDLAPLEPPNLFPTEPFPLSGSDALLGGIGDRDLQPLSSPTGIDTLSGQLDATQDLPIHTSKTILAASPYAAESEPAPGSVRQWIVDAVAREAEEGEGIGGLKYRLWFLILFGILSGLIVAGVGYSIIHTLSNTPPVEQERTIEP